MDSNYISEDEFWDDWRVIQGANGELFDIDDVKDQPINHVWKILESGDCDDHSIYASPGFHIVNRIGYVLTKEAWVNGERDAIYHLDEFHHTV